MAVVHGGGLQITRMLEKMNVKSVFLEGLRVTDETALAAVAAALLGEVHTALVGELQRLGIPAIGVFGAVHSTRKPGPWGLVGTNVHANAATLSTILDVGQVPVVPTLALGEESLLNVNGDETAAAVAAARAAFVSRGDDSGTHRTGNSVTAAPVTHVRCRAVIYCFASTRAKRSCASVRRTLQMTNLDIRLEQRHHAYQWALIRRYVDVEGSRAVL